MSSSINMMYHFVGIDQKYKGTTLEDFKFQLEFLQKNYADDEFILTFDHGTIDHYEIVLPELEKRNLKGLFFIMTIVPEEGIIPAIDKQRFLEGDCRHDLTKHICEHINIKYNPNESKFYLKHLTFYSLEERYLRFLRDKILRPEEFEKAISYIFTNKFGDELEFSQRYYMDWEHIKQLNDLGHIIGSHSHSHTGDYLDYKKSFDLISNNLKIGNNYISYPNGKNKLNDNELKGLNIKKAFISYTNGDDLYNIGRIDDKFFYLVKKS